MAYDAVLSKALRAVGNKALRRVGSKALGRVSSKALRTVGSKPGSIAFGMTGTDTSVPHIRGTSLR